MKEIADVILGLGNGAAGWPDSERPTGLTVEWPDGLDIGAASISGLDSGAACVSGLDSGAADGLDIGVAGGLDDGEAGVSGLVCGAAAVFGLRTEKNW